ncbi:hypothetical protein CUJ83_01970 [Methanocella sp. CWC-04]|uniref:Glycoside hydrolase family 57 N-terminal domain-containing protein n=1 Tax=Methanooceanicella nereidis TaxID=2052831 RepID=A0AAP2RCJ1_9EURY|nr:hypothetical protein [Methanocella sp. CWC-04]MCD1293762.1 hypothetical protein [Methanocella sp. CWC-04]
MRSVCIIFEMRQPLPLRWYWPKEGYREADPYPLYFDVERQRGSFEKRVNRSYLPSNELLLDLIEKQDAKFSLSMTGNFLELCAENKELTGSLKSLVDTGNVELIGKPYYETLACFPEPMWEFMVNVILHKDALLDMFGYVPATFANTGLIFNEKICKAVKGLGFSRALIHCNGLDSRFGYLTGDDLIAIPVHKNLSSDIESRFSDRKWEDYPLKADKYAGWIAKMDAEITTIYVDYGSFGYRHDRDTGIFKFLASLPGEFERHGIRMITPAEYEAVEAEYSEFYTAVSRYPMDDILGNHMQNLYYCEVTSIEDKVKKCPEWYVDIWRRLQTIDVLMDMKETMPWYPWDKTVSNLLLFSDFKRRVIEAMP